MSGAARVVMLPHEAQPDGTTDLIARLRDEGGFTVDPVDLSSPADGFAVSLPDYEIRTSLDSADLADEIRLTLSRAFETADGYAGGWVDTDGTVYLDVSQVVYSQASAESLARKHDQLAYFDLDSKITHYVTEKAS